MKTASNVAGTKALKSTSAMQSHRGFTLIELMIVVAIIGLIVGIAFPAYQDQIRTTRRADAMASAMTISNAMEKHFTETGSYDNVPASLERDLPWDGAGKFYTVDITPDGKNGFDITISPIAGTSQENDGDITLTSTGKKGWTGSDTGECWSKTC